MHALFRSLLDRLPATCEVCGRWPAEPVCDACVLRFSAPRLRCGACAAPMAVDTGHCGACITRPVPAAFERCVVAVDYAYPWDGLVTRFKFRNQPGWARTMARLMLQSPEVAPLLRRADLMVPIPLTAARLGSRGYNQAWELAKALSQLAALNRQRPAPILAEGLVRVAEAPDQHSLPRAERLLNLRGIFSAHPAQLRRLGGRHVLLVDDVTTTGATLEAAAQALRQAGTRRVSALAFARTPGA